MIYIGEENLHMCYSLDFIDVDVDFRVTIPGDIREHIPNKGELITFDGSTYKVLNRQFVYATSGQFSKLERVIVSIQLELDTY